MSSTLNRQNSIRFYQILAVISESESTWNELSDDYTHGTQKLEHKIATLASFVMVHENCTEKHRILITQGFSSQTELDPWVSYHHKGNCKVSWNSNRGIWRKGLMPWFTKPTIAAALHGEHQTPRDRLQLIPFVFKSLWVLIRSPATIERNLFRD